MEQEIRNQIVDLPSFASQLRRQGIFKLEAAKTIFAGSGDSYACVLYAHNLSKGLSEAYDPYELSTTLACAKGKDVVIVSISGQTRANIELARRLQGVVRRTIAVTYNPDSPLGKACNDTLLLRYRSSGVLTSGTVSFTTSLVVCSFLQSMLPATLSIEDSMGNAAGWAKKVRSLASGCFVFVGSGVYRALAEYGVCKVQEVLGQKASAVVPEQLGHAQLFTLNPSKDTLVFLGTDRDKKTKEVFNALSKRGFNACSIGIVGKNVLAESLTTCFHLQHLVLTIARRRRMKECAFLLDRARLRLSNALIY